MAKRRWETFDWGILPLRVVVGLVFVVHGYQKLFGGGMPRLEEVVGGLGFQPAFVWAVTVAGTELIGGLGVFLGLLTRLSGFGLVCVMGIAVFKVHWASGFLSKNGGYEYPLMLLGASLTLMVLGAGRITMASILRKDL